MDPEQAVEYGLIDEVLTLDGEQEGTAEQEDAAEKESAEKESAEKESAEAEA
jgi:hypothetical protein